MISLTNFLKNSRKDTSDLLSQESDKLNGLLAVFILCALSGLIILFFKNSFAAQINVLAHIGAGILFSFFVVRYVILHFKRTLGVRKPALIVSGLITAIALLLYLLFSFQLAYYGHQKTMVYLQTIHTYASVVIILSALLHIKLYRFVKYKKGENRFHTLKISNIKSIGFCVLTYLLAIMALSIFYQFAYPEKGPLTIENYEYSYGDHPFLPSQTETENNQFIRITDITGSEECGSCHSDIAKQWEVSAHRFAAADPTYVTNVSLLAEKKGIAATRYCEGCHAPIALLTGQLTPGGKHGGISDTPANHEGVNCLSCHRMTRIIHLEGVGSYHFEPANDYLFDKSITGVSKSINHYLIKTFAEQHKQDMGNPLLKEPSMCATCHSQFMDKSMNDWGWVKMQDDYQAWLDSPYSKGKDHNFSNSEEIRCQDCHMPKVPANDPTADEKGLVRSHAFVAANTMLPLMFGNDEHLKETIDFLQSNKMRISIDRPNRADAVQSTLNLNERLRQHSETPSYFYLGETVNLTISVSNVGVGHDFPGGTTDINQAWVYLSVRDSLNNSIFTSGEIGDDEFLDPQSYIYQSIPIDRNGNHVWRHDLFNMTGETYKNVVKAGKTDIVNYRFDLPSWVKGPIIIEARLKYRKLNTKYAKWALGDLYRPLPVVDMAQDTLVLDILHEPPTKGQ